ncbi:Uncharacterised protein [Bordetella pertussis]|nr:Uncharacterised protein [Bordetella pertussis]
MRACSSAATDSSLAPIQITMMGRWVRWRACAMASVNALAMLCIRPTNSTMASLPGSRATASSARPMLAVSCTTLPVRSSGLAACTKEGNTGARALAVCSASGGRASPHRSASSAISTPAPPETDITAIRRPCGTLSNRYRRAASIIWPSESTRSAPCWRRQASYRASSPASAPVCEAAAAAPACERPALMAMTGLPASAAARSARRNATVSRMSSTYRPMTRVSASPAR